MKKNRKIFILILISCFFIGCASPFAEFYNDEMGGLDISLPPHNKTYEFSNKEPEIIRANANELDENFISMIEKGFQRVGHSNFNAGNINENGVIIQAKKVHASVILMYSKFSHTESGILPLTLPDSQTSNTYSSGSVYGSGGGYANYSESSTTTTNGSTTTYIPYNTDRYFYYASYWVKIKTPFSFGIFSRDLSPETRRKLGRNNGRLILAVLKNGPAWDANILIGDILIKIGDIEIGGLESLEKLVKKFGGHEVQVELIRDGKIIKKLVKFNKSKLDDREG